jgi:hypothetical protein
MGMAFDLFFEVVKMASQNGGDLVTRYRLRMPHIHHDFAYGLFAQFFSVSISQNCEKHFFKETLVMKIVTEKVFLILKLICPCF